MPLTAKKHSCLTSTENTTAYNILTYDYHLYSLPFLSETGIFYQNTSLTLVLSKLLNMPFLLFEVCLCLFACCVFMGLAAWNKMNDDDDTGYSTVLYSVGSCASTHKRRQHSNTCYSECHKATEGRGRPRNTLKIYLEREMWTDGFRFSWRKVETAAQDRAGWIRMVCGLCSTGSDKSWHYPSIVYMTGNLKGALIDL